MFLKAEKEKKSKKVIGDFIYTFMATAVMNVVLQIIIYPVITKVCGESFAGDIFFFVGIIYIVPQAVGTALGNARLVIRKNNDTYNGDYTSVLTVYSSLAAVVCGAVALFEKADALFVLLYIVFGVVYSLRTYAQVEYRIKLNFKGYFIYYLIVSGGYLVGFGLFWLTGLWLLIFLVGEIAGVAYTIIKMDIFKKEMRVLSPKFVFSQVSLLFFSYLIRDGINQYDKVILKQILGSSIVTQYTALSMVSKIFQMFVAPINTLILSYLTAKDSKMNKTQYKKFLGIGLGAGAVFYGVSLIGTWVYLKLFYNQFYADVIQYSYLANLGIIAGFVATLYMTVLLSMNKSKLYTVIQIAWGAVYICLGYILTAKLALWGIIITTVVVNCIEMIVAIIVSYNLVKKAGCE